MTIRRRPRAAALATATAAALALTACGGNDEQTTVTDTTTTTSPTTSEESAPVPEAVTRVLDALDELEAEYTEPVEAEPGELSGAARKFDLDIVGYDAGINLFPDTASLDRWQEASNGVGGISVTVDTTAVSLNSHEGRDASLALAPQLAEKLGGGAHTGGEEPVMSTGGETASASSEPRVVECLEGTPGPAFWSDGTTSYSEDCWLENGGPEYAEAEGNATSEYWENHPQVHSRYGNESGVDWQDKNTNRDWSDEEVDAYIACFEKYDYNEYAAYNC